VSLLLDPPVETRDTVVDVIELEIDAIGEEQAVRVYQQANASRTLLTSFPLEGPAPDLDPVVPKARAIQAVDVLEYVTDEEAWIGRLADRLAPNGTLTVRLPLEGPLAWLDAYNMYRYVQDTTGIGKDLDETKSKGWHRHYRERDVRQMVEEAGLEVVSFQRSGSPHVDALHFVALAWGAIRGRERQMETRTRAWSKAAAAESNGVHLGRFSSRVTVVARKPS